MWASGTNQNSVPANDNSRRNQILNGNVISQAVTAQPGSPTEGDIYIIAATHTGTQWAGFTPLDLAIYSGGTWYAFAPVKGVTVSIAGVLYTYSGSAWTVGGSGMTNPMTTVGDIIYGGTAGAPTRLAAGLVGQILSGAGSGVAPVWAYPLINVNPQSTAYTFALTDGGGLVYHPTTDTTARTWTIPANSSVAFPVGSAITIDNDTGAGALTIAITTDTLILVGAAGSTGSRTLAAGGQATIVKVTATRWRISGTGLT